MRSALTVGWCVMPAPGLLVIATRRLPLSTNTRSKDTCVMRTLYGTAHSYLVTWSL